MKQVTLILLAAALTYTASYTLGALLLRWLRLDYRRSVARLMSFAGGSALFSTLIFLVTAAGGARRGVFIAMSAAIVAVGAWQRVWRTADENTPEEPIVWRAVFWAVFGVFTFYYLGNALAPEVSPDGAVYHVGLPARYLREHHFPAITTNLYASLSQGVEMLFLFAFSIGKHSATAMVHFLFLLVLPFALRSYARSIGRPAAGIVAALLVYLSPIVAKDGTVAYVDCAAALVAFTLFYALENWRVARRGVRELVLAGLLAGFAFAVKYTLGLAVIYALGYVAVYAWRRNVLRAVLVTGLAASSLMLPWLVKNTIVMQNPLAPFANRMFPNPYMYASFETEYVEFFRHMSGVTLPQVPIEATVRGEKLTGLIGPVFLLLPLALFSLRRREGRALLLAGLLFLLPYYNNIGTRFLIPVLPFAAMALAMVLAEWRFAAPVVLSAHVLLSWPSVIPLYSAPYVWRIENANWAAALRKTPEAEYIKQQRDDAEIINLIERVVPAGDTVFSPPTGNAAYCSRNLVGAFESRLGQRTYDMLYRVVSGDLRTTYRHRFRFTPATVRRVRVMTAAVDPKPLLISEIRFWRQGKEILRSPAWRLRASTNPWEVQSAFDNSPLTVWTVGDRTNLGIFLETTFGQDEMLDEVTVDIPQNQKWARFRLESAAADGVWKPLGGEAEMISIDWPARMRKAAVEQLRSDGFQWIVMRNGDTLADDISERSAQWGVKIAGEANPYRLWHLE